MKNVVLPSWITWGVVAAAVVALLAVWGWIKPLVEGPDFSTVTIYQPKPVPVEVEKVRWLKGKTEVREIPVEVIREVPVKTAERLEREFDLTLPELQGEGKELLEVLAVPRAPHGGEMALTVHTGTGKVDGIFRAKRRPFIELGGIREAGVQYDVITATPTGYYEQDLVRIGPGIVRGRAFASAGKVPAYGVSLGVAIRF